MDSAACMGGGSACPGQLGWNGAGEIRIDGVLITVSVEEAALVSPRLLGDHLVATVAFRRRSIERFASAPPWYHNDCKPAKCLPQ